MKDKFAEKAAKETYWQGACQYQGAIYKDAERKRTNAK